MPFPNTTLELLIRREPLSKNDWIQLLEQRRADIRPFLKRFTLPTFGKDKILDGFANLAQLYDLPVWKRVHMGSPDLSLYTQGFFWMVRHEIRTTLLSPIKTAPEYLDSFFGLIRSGEWVQGRVEYRRIANPPHFGEGRDAFEVFQINLNYNDFQRFHSLKEEDLRLIWVMLQQQFQLLRDRQAELLGDTKRICDQFSHEESLVKLIDRISVRPPRVVV